MRFWLFTLVFLSCLLPFIHGYQKICTNGITQQSLSTKSLKYEFATSKNETWKKEIMSHDHDHDHLIPTDEEAWSTLYPRKKLGENDDEYSWNVLYKNIKYSNKKLKGSFLNEISLHNVRLDPKSLYGRAQQTNLEYLMMLDNDNLLYSFRKTAGLPAPGTPYGGWEAPNIDLRGHFVGHYLSATAKMWASTHNETLKSKMDALVSDLKECQDALKSGYLSAFPTDLFDSLEDLKPVWAPYYTIHKIMAGLLDQYNIAGNSQALKMVSSMADYFYNRVQNVVKQYSISRHWFILNEETGGMNDVLYRLYSVTANDLSDYHANTHIPIVIGAQMRYEVTGDELYKVSRNLFRWTKEVNYADYYERALINGVLSIQRGTEPGIMIYMLPLGHGVSKGKSYHGWGTQYNTFWCCYGTGIESFSKLGDSIYFEETSKVPGLYVIQYIPSTVNWTSADLSLTQVVDDVVSGDKYMKVKIKVSTKKTSGTATLNLRIPSWTSSIDDRSDYDNLQAILYGPYLLAGLSKGDYDLQTGSVKSVSDWISEIPKDYNSYLISLSQESKSSKFYLSAQNQSITMQESPQPGNDTNVHATFRLIFLTKSLSHRKIPTPKSVIGKTVNLEPFDLPGMVLAHQGGGEVLTVINATDDKRSAEFRIVKGLNGKDGMISLKTKEGCFVYADISSENELNVKLNCDAEGSDHSFKDKVSFDWNDGLKKYHPISFVAKGLKRSYVLEPLLGMRDEYYNVYFNVTR
ncbi:DNA damage checkpoint protein LCD1 [Bienertia sinuspersici]